MGLSPGRIGVSLIKDGLTDQLFRLKCLSADLTSTSQRSQNSWAARTFAVRFPHIEYYLCSITRSIFVVFAASQELAFALNAVYAPAIGKREGC